ncbi:MAG: hypothetical protein H7230_04135 [Candidatus Parcubacteria bacterium]|nr:hypothetical protein [Candidatus Paceibacterota bacterium]
MSDPHFYQILLATNIPSPILTYKLSDSESNPTLSSSRTLSQGQLVSVPVRGRVVHGVVLESLKRIDINYDIDKIQSIETVYSYILPEASLKTIRIFNLATFNNAGLILETILHAYLSLADKHQKSVLEYHQQIQQIPPTPFIKGEKREADLKAYKTATPSQDKPVSVLGNYDFDISIPSRIMYLIRIHSQMSNFTSPNPTILIICPEVKMLTRLYTDLSTQIQPADNLEIHQYTSSVNQANRNLILNILTDWNHFEHKKLSKKALSSNSNKQVNSDTSLIGSKVPKLKVILCTRAGLFLPFGQLERVILVDEANAMYYQDSNSLYFDTRELVLWVQRSYHCYLDFVSLFPSIRLRSFGNKPSLDTSTTKVSAKHSKPVSIQLSHYDSKMTQNRIFGPQIEAILNDEIGIVDTSAK